MISTKVVTATQNEPGRARSLERILASGLRELLRLLAHGLTATRARWIGCEPAHKRRIYFANHASHADFLLLWAALPGSLRRRVRPVAAADYWLESRVRRFIVNEVFRAVLVDRVRSGHAADAIEVMARALASGNSLIVFPEGCRNTMDTPLLPFKSGLYRLARLLPETELVPVWLDNVDRVLPKGAVVPVPLLCTVTFGPPMRLRRDEDKDAFLRRARDALLALAEPPSNGSNWERR